MWSDVRATAVVVVKSVQGDQPAHLPIQTNPPVSQPACQPASLPSILPTRHWQQVSQSSPPTRPGRCGRKRRSQDSPLRDSARGQGTPLLPRTPALPPARSPGVVVAARSPTVLTVVVVVTDDREPRAVGLCRALWFTLWP